MMPDVQLVSVIIPVHNAASYIEDTLNRILSDLRHHSLELILVENGSTDNSWELINDLSRRLQLWGNSKVIILKSEPGLGRALYLGAKASSGNIIWVTGDDLPFGTDDFKCALPLLKLNTFIVGSKLHAESKVNRNLLRFLLTRLYRFARMCILRSKVLDSQGTLITTGQLFRRLSLACKEGGYLFTTEILYHAELLNIEIIEIPVRLEKTTNFKSNLQFGDPFKMFMGLIRIRYVSTRK
jgi:dolichyl-phosphate beta-glucosyltransferase